MSWSVFTGKCGLKVKASSLWRATKRRVSSISYGSLFLMLPNATIGGWLLVSLKSPPSSTGT